MIQASVHIWNMFKYNDYAYYTDSRYRLYSIKLKEQKRWINKKNVDKKKQLENVFVKHYAPNHMPDPKGEWSLKENNSELHYGICSKVYQFIYTLVCNYMPIMRILAKAVLQISCSKVVPIQNACVQKRRVTQPKIYRIGSKVNHFIYTLVCNYMPNIRILAKSSS